MGSRLEIQALQQRIAQAQQRCIGWRAARSGAPAGGEERYLEAFCTVEALELQLELRLRRDVAAEPL